MAKNTVVSCHLKENSFNYSKGGNTTYEWADFANISDISVPALYSLDHLARKYRGKYRLDLEIRCQPKTMKRRRYANSARCNKEFTDAIMEWEADINESSGKEAIIYVENFVDDCTPPEHFKYITTNLLSEEAKACFNPEFLIGCNCNRCGLKSSCSCLPHGGNMAYDKNRRLILQAGSPVYECNKSCKCSNACQNRVLQLGRKIKMKIFRTSDGRGWGAKTEEFIHKGQFVVEYVGEIISSDEAERRGKIYDAVQQTYLFDLDFHDRQATFTIDAYTYGNVSHFLNHSCDPNLQTYSVWVDTLDPRLPHIGLYAKRDIIPGEELTFDYLMTREFTGSSKKCKRIQRVMCACGADNCRKYLF